MSTKEIFNMSDNEDLLGDDLGDQSLADYNLGNDEEEQLLADDYEGGSSQNVPTSMGPGYGSSVEMVPNEFPGHSLEYNAQLPYQPLPEPECVVPNITVEVPNTPIVPIVDPNMFPFEPPVYGPEHAVVPPPIPAAVPMESSQIVPSEMAPPVSTRDAVPRPRFVNERGPRLPRVRDIPDSLDKVIVRGQRGRGNWRQRFSHPYHRNNMHRVNFNHRQSFPPPQIRASPPQIRPEIRPERPEIQPDPVPIAPPPINVLPELSPERPMPQEVPFRPENPPFGPENSPFGPENSPFRPENPPFRHEDPEFRPENPPIRSEPPFRPGNPPFRHENPQFRPENPQFRPENPRFRPDNPQFGPENPPFRPENPPFGHFRFQYRPEERNFRPNFGPYPRQFGPRPFGPPIREIAPNNASHMPQVTIRQPVPTGIKAGGREPEVRMLPLQLPANLPPGGLAGKKVLINPHFKGTFQPPVDGLPLPAYIPSRIVRSPPTSPTVENKFGAIKDLDDAAERFIAEQRNALARAATRKFRRSPQRYIENTTIEIENELAAPARRNSEDELLRRQEEFINANRAGLRRRMRTPSPPETPRENREPTREPIRDNREPIRESREPIRESRDVRDRRRSLSPRRRTSPVRDEESEYRRRMREQESLRERVLRAKEVRRRKNAVAATQTSQNARNNEDVARNRDRDRSEKDKEPLKPVKSEEKVDVKPDSTAKEHVRERSPVTSAEVNSTSEALTPPRENLPRMTETPEPAMTPPLPEKLDNSVDKSAEKSADKFTDKLLDSDDDLDMILGDIDGILSDDEDSGRFKEKPKKAEPLKVSKPSDLRSKLPPRTSAEKPKQRIVFGDDTNKASSPPRRAAASSSTVVEDETSKINKTKQKSELITKSRQRIIFDRKETQQQERQEKDDERKPQTFPNRRVILQNKFTQQQTKEKSVFSRIEKTEPLKFSRIEKTDPSKPNPGIFSRAVRTAIGSDKNRIVVKKDEPTVEYGSDSEEEETALVSNLPEGMTDTRLKTLAGSDVQAIKPQDINFSKGLLRVGSISPRKHLKGPGQPVNPKRR